MWIFFELGFEASKFERYANIACTNIFRWSITCVKKKRLKHLGIFWGMSPMNLFLQEERYLSSRLAPDSINRSQEKLLTLKKTTIYIYIYTHYTYMYGEQDGAW